MFLNVLFSLAQSCYENLSYLSRIMRKPAFTYTKNKGADQLGGNRADDQRLCFRYTASKFPLLSESDCHSHLLLLYSPVFDGHGRNSPRQGFS